MVSLSQLPGRAATPAPPGLSSFPKKGEVYLSPALAELIHKLPAGQLADRFPKPAAYGTIGTAGLASPDELVAVVGRAPSDPRCPRRPAAATGTTRGRPSGPTLQGSPRPSQAEHIHRQRLP